MARIALVLSGQLRSFAKGYEYMFENLLRHHQVDVYFHTWSKNWNHGVLQYLPAQFLVEDDKVFGDYPIFRIASRVFRELRKSFSHPMPKIQVNLFSN